MLGSPKVKMEGYVDTLIEAQKRLDDEDAAEAAAAAADAAAEAADAADRRAALDRKRAYRADMKRERGSAYLDNLQAERMAKEARWARDDARHKPYEGRTKGDIERQKVVFQREDIEAWRNEGLALGLLDGDYEPITPTPDRPTQANSHIPDAVVHHDEVAHVVGDHPMHSYSAGALAVLASWHGHSAVKVI